MDIITKDISSSQFCTYSRRMHSETWDGDALMNVTKASQSINLSLSQAHTHRPPPGHRHTAVMPGSERELLPVHGLGVEVGIWVPSSLSCLGGEPFILSPAGIWLFSGSNLSLVLCFTIPHESAGAFVQQFPHRQGGEQKSQPYYFIIITTLLYFSFKFSTLLQCIWQILR